MQGFIVGPEGDPGQNPGGRYLVVASERGNQRPLYARIDDVLMSFVEEEQHRRRLPGRSVVPKAVIVSFAIEVYRELLREAGRLAGMNTAIPPEMERLLTLARHCLSPISVPTKHRREQHG